MLRIYEEKSIDEEENSVWCGAKFSNITKWHYFLDEPNLKLKNKTCQEISKITKWHYVVDELNLKFKNKTCQENESHITKTEGAMLMIKKETSSFYLGKIGRTLPKFRISQMGNIF